MSTPTKAKRRPAPTQTRDLEPAAPIALAPSRPQPPSWRLISSSPAPDAKRIAAACSQCSQVREFSAEAWRSGMIAPCPCTRLAANRAGRTKSFAADLARDVHHGAAQRHRGGGQ